MRAAAPQGIPAPRLPAAPEQWREARSAPGKRLPQPAEASPRKRGGGARFRPGQRPRRRNRL